LVDLSRKETVPELDKDITSIQKKIKVDEVTITLLQKRLKAAEKTMKDHQSLLKSKESIKA
jgi:uncharacterized coiled-coil protein SlyX